MYREPTPIDASRSPLILREEYRYCHHALLNMLGLLIRVQKTRLLDLERCRWTLGKAEGVYPPEDLGIDNLGRTSMHPWRGAAVETDEPARGKGDVAISTALEATVTSLVEEYGPCEVLACLHQVTEEEPAASILGRAWEELWFGHEMAKVEAADLDEEAEALAEQQRRPRLRLLRLRQHQQDATTTNNTEGGKDNE